MGVIVLALLAVGVAVYFARQILTPPPPLPPSGHPRGPVVARATLVEGRVDVKWIIGPEWYALSTSDDLAPGDLVKTRPQSAVSLQFKDCHEARISADSLVTIEAQSERVEAGGGTFSCGGRTVQFPDGVYRPETTAGGKPQVEVDVRDGDTTIRQYEGNGSVERPGGAKVALAAGEQARVRKGDATTPVERLLPAPELLAPPPDTVVGLAPGAPAYVFWKRVPEAARYRVQVDTGVLFGAPGVDTTTTEATVAIPSLAPGEYWWRVVALSATGTPGRFAEPSRFVVRPRTPEPPRLEVTLFEVKGPMVHVAGRTTPGAVLAVDDVSVEVDAEGGFDEHVLLSGRKVVVFRAVSRQGDVKTLERRLP